MELRQLEYFLAVVRHGSVRHAADALDVSPGNTSEQIKSLERELGVRLFDRGPRFLVDFMNRHPYVDLRLIERGATCC